MNADATASGDMSAEVGKTLLISRQPIFDREGDLWGYELLVSGTEESRQGAGSEPDGPTCAENMLKSLLAEELSRKIFADKAGGGINCLLRNPPPSLFGSGFRCDDAAGKLAVAVDAGCGPDAVECLKGKDMIAVMDILGDTPPSIFQSADMVSMSLKKNSPKDVMKFRSAGRGYTGGLLASDVASWEGYQGTRALGFNYFQGSFFTKPEKVSEKELTAGALTKLKLLGELNAAEIEINRLAEVIGADVALSYKLLRYINSPAFGLSVKVKSIQQAISLLGLREIKRWSIMVLISDLDATAKGMELAYLSLQRGRFLETICDESKLLSSGDKEGMFLTGLFSNIDALLTCSMEQALEEVPLDDEIRDALCGTENALTPWLDLLKAIERGDWSRARERMLEFGIRLPKASSRYLQASTWAADRLSGMRV